MNTNVTTTNQNRTPVASLRGLLDSDAYKGRFQALLGERAPQFISTLIQLSQGWGLRDCDPNSIIASAMTAAALDLPIDKNLGFAHIVPYGNVAQFQLGYKGFVQLGLRSGQYLRLNTTEVYDGELISFDRVRGDFVLDPTKKTKPAKVVGYVAYMRLVNGYEQFDYWTVEEVEDHAMQYSKAYAKGKETPWKTNFDAMALKTVIKSLLSHWGILSVQMQKALVADQGVQVSVDSEIQYPDNDPTAIAGAEPAKLVYGKTEDVKQTPKETEAPKAKVEEVIPPGIDYTTMAREDRDKLAYDWMQRDGVTEAQVLAWAKASKMCGPKIEEIPQLREEAVNTLLKDWSKNLDTIKAGK